MTPFSYLESIHHDGSGRYVRGAGRPLRLGDEVTLRLRAAADAPIERVFLRTCPDGEQHFTEMTPQDGVACRWWQARLRVDEPVVGYRFLLFAADGVWWVNGGGPQRHNPTDAQDFRLLADFDAPAWVQESVFYQIFPDRFADGDLSSNVCDGEYVYHGQPVRARRWGEPPTPYAQGGTGEFYGGDLAGIEQHLDDLLDLGVNALYLNPIFTAYSNHRYDVIDYDHVDPHLGGNAALVSLRSAMAERGMRLILDIVPNHCGVGHPWFREAQRTLEAPTAEYFTFFDHPHDYACWLGHKGLPKFNYNSAALRQVMYDGPHSVFRRWLRQPYAIDGWRIDVANMLGRQGQDQMGVEVARGVRRAVKAENPAAYLVGEHFFDGTPQLQGDQWDATMNYAGFSIPVWNWLGRFSVDQFGWAEPVTSEVPWSTQAMVDTWRAFRAAIPWAIARQQFNLLGSHDTARIRTVVGADPGRLRLAVGLLMTAVGVPSILYGDEIGLEGEGSATRACMPWERSAWDEELRDFYAALIRLRRTSPALIDGGFQVLLVEENALAYVRDADAEWIVVVGHRGPGVRPAGPLPVAHGAIPDGLTFVDVITGQRATVVGGCLPLPEMEPGVSIWQATR
ncbi:MAG: maltodextrin glucosidase [Anaerolineae bacterium]|nr:maltodextrin glucosidase [Anaerolineae bacterium]